MAVRLVRGRQLCYWQFAIMKVVMLGSHRSLRWINSPRHYGIYLKLLREATEEIAGAMMIFGPSLAADEVTEHWRVANVAPLLKM